MDTTSYPSSFQEEMNKKQLIRESEELFKNVEKLKTIWETYTKLYEEDYNNFYSSQEKTYFLISNCWLIQFSDFLQQQLKFQEQQPEKQEMVLEQDSTSIKPPGYDINQELIDQKAQPLFKTTNTISSFLKEESEYDKDYKIISKQTWEFMLQYFPLSTEFQRNTHETSGSKVVEAKLYRLKCIVINNDELKQIEQNMNLQNIRLRGLIALSQKNTLKDIYSQIQSQFSRNDEIRLWKVNFQTNYQKLFEKLKELCKKNLDYNYKILMNTTYYDHEKEKDKLLEELQLTVEDILIIEHKPPHQIDWSLYNSQVPAKHRCEKCGKTTLQKFICQCQEASYCSEICQSEDYNHQQKCSFRFQMESGMISTQLVQSQNSVMGVCGLQNLGNTCYMNSGLQCLSNTKELTEYFLSNEYKKDINTDAVMGCKGELAEIYGVLIRKMWFGTQNVQACRQFKKRIGEYNPIFSGFTQNDSQELTLTTIDVLHEDLNKIKKKPYVENKDNDGSIADEIASVESWENFKLRNDSFLVDLMYGQYKSHIKCPDCGKISITFDPFSIMTLPMPQTSQRDLKVVIFDDSREYRQIQSTKIPYDENKRDEIRFLLQDAAQLIGVDVGHLMIYEKKSFITGIKLDSSISDFHNSYGDVVIRRISQFEAAIPLERKVLTEVEYQKLRRYSQSSRPYMNTFWQLRQYFDDEMTFKQVHLYFYQKLRPLFEEKIDPSKSDEENYRILALDHEDGEQKIFEIEIGCSQSGQICIFCKKDRWCSTCLLPYTDQTIAYARSQKRYNSYSDFKFEVKLNKIDESYLQMEDPLTYIDSQRQKQFEEEQQRLRRQQLKNERNMEIESNNHQEHPSQSDTDNKMQTEAQEPSKPTFQKNHIYYSFQNLQNMEILEEDNMWYCNMCKEHKKAEKTLKIYKIPPVLILHLKRFKTKDRGHYITREKNDQLVEFPFEMDLNEYLGLQLENQVGANLYELYAVSNHFGGMGGGHYTAYAKNHYTGKWYNYNDSSVTEVKDLKEIVSEAAYVLFYRKKQLQSNFQHVIDLSLINDSSGKKEPFLENRQQTHQEDIYE